MATEVAGTYLSSWIEGDDLMDEKTHGREVTNMAMQGILGPVGVYFEGDISNLPGSSRFFANRVLDVFNVTGGVVSDTFVEEVYD